MKFMLKINKLICIKKNFKIITKWKFFKVKNRCLFISKLEAIKNIIKFFNLLLFIQIFIEICD